MRDVRGGASHIIGTHEIGWSYGWSLYVTNGGKKVESNMGSKEKSLSDEARTKWEISLFSMTVSVSLSPKESKESNEKGYEAQVKKLA